MKHYKSKIYFKKLFKNAAKYFKINYITNLYTEFLEKESFMDNFTENINQNNIRLTPGVEKTLALLNNNGFDAYIVGGCVRDMLMGRAPKDYDITTSAAPDEVKAIFKKTYDTGLEHGTVTVRMCNELLEVTTFRADGNYEDFRHPKEVFFTKDINEDLKRRDFTMNAIAYSPKTGLVDPENGCCDIKNAVIKGVGNPLERFTEDALRMLRALRFSAQLGFDIHPITLAAISEKSPLIKHISSERIKDELQKLICSPSIEKLPLLWKTGLLLEISPSLNRIASFEEEILSQMCLLPVNPILRWSALLYHCKSPKAELKALKADNRTIKLVESICREAEYPLPDSEYELRKAVCRLGHEAFSLLLEFKSLEASKGCLELYNKILSNKDCIFISDLKIDGNELLSLGIPKGAAVGQALKGLLDAVHKNPSLNTPDSLKNLALKLS